MMTLDAAQIRDLQTGGIDWTGEDLLVDGKWGPKTAWWAYICSLPDVQQSIVLNALHYYHIGTKEDAGRHNRGKIVDMFQEAGGLGPGNPWCAAFVSYIMRKSQADWPVYHMSAWSIIEWAKATGRITDTPQPGFCFAFLYTPEVKGFTPGHCGVIVANDDKHIVDCDGNAGDRVRVGYRARKGLTFIRTVEEKGALPVMPDIKTLPSLDGTKTR
jgi:hypothetical protein